MPAVTGKERPLDPSSLAFHKHLLLFITILKTALVYSLDQKSLG